MNQIGFWSRFVSLPKKAFIQRAVKPLPSGGGYKAHLNWNFSSIFKDGLCKDTTAILCDKDQMDMKKKNTVSSSTYIVDFFYRATIIRLWNDYKPTSFSFDQKPSRKKSCGVEHSGGRAGRVSLWSGKGLSTRVEAGTCLWRGSLEPLPIGNPRLQAGEDVNINQIFYIIIHSI